MDKITARNSIANAGVSARDIAHSIYLATVRGVSGANQNDGMGFLLSAMAELWNIRGVVGNPNAKTKITGRYREMNVTEQMILNVISQYPNGFNGYQPSFDELLCIGVSRTNKNRQSAYDDFENYYNTSKGVATSQPVVEQPKILHTSEIKDIYADFGVGYGGNITSHSQPVVEQPKILDASEIVDEYADFGVTWDEDDYDEGEDDEVVTQQSSRYSDEEVRATAELSVSMALKMVEALTGQNYDEVCDTLIDYAISAIREMGY